METRKELASAGAIMARRQETLTAEAIDHGFEVVSLAGHQDVVRVATFAPRNDGVLTGSDDSTVRLWDLPSGKEMRRFEGHEYAVVGVSFVGTDQIVSVGVDLAVRFWDISTGRQSRFELIPLDEDETADDPHGYPIAMALSADSRFLLVGRGDAVHVLEPTSGNELRSYKKPDTWVHCIAFSPEGRRAVCGFDRVLSLWDVPTARELRRFEGHEHNVYAVHFSPDGQYIVSGSARDMRLWDVVSGREISRFEHPEGAYVNSVAFSPNGRHAMSACDDGSLRLWGLKENSELSRWKAHSGAVRSVAFSADGALIASAGDDNSVRVWRSSLGVFPGHVGPVR